MLDFVALSGLFGVWVHKLLLKLHDGCLLPIYLFPFLDLLGIQDEYERLMEIKLISTFESSIEAISIAWKSENAHLVELRNGI